MYKVTDSHYETDRTESIVWHTILMRMCSQLLTILQAIYLSGTCLVYVRYMFGKLPDKYRTYTEHIPSIYRRCDGRVTRHRRVRKGRMVLFIDLPSTSHPSSYRQPAPCSSSSCTAQRWCLRCCADTDTPRGKEWATVLNHNTAAASRRDDR